MDEIISIFLKELADMQKWFLFSLLFTYNKENPLLYALNSFLGIDYFEANICHAGYNSKYGHMILAMIIIVLFLFAILDAVW